METLKIKVSKYNEVSPDEIERLLKLGGRIISHYSIRGPYLGTFKTKSGETVYPKTGDEILINYLTLPLPMNTDTLEDKKYFSDTLEIKHQYEN